MEGPREPMPGQGPLAEEIHTEIDHTVSIQKSFTPHPAADPPHPHLDSDVIRNWITAKRKPRKPDAIPALMNQDQPLPYPHHLYSTRPLHL